MEFANDKDFKYVIQDTSHLYLGARMSFQEMLAWEDVPFKMKSIIHKHFLEEGKEETGFADALAGLTEKSFTYQVCKQLRLKVKAGIYQTKINRKGEEKRKYVSKMYSLDEYLKLIEGTQEVVTEEISVSKLALLAFSL